MTGGDDDLLGAEALELPLERVLTIVRPSSVVAGWATVELDRATDEVGAALGEARLDPVPAADDELLGARARLVRFADRDVVLLEPSTEGPLAASLARFGEGIAVRYLVGDAQMVHRVRAAGLRLSAVGNGPLGRERRLLVGPAWGPHLLLVDAEPAGAAATMPAMTEPGSVALRRATADDAEQIAALLTEEGYPGGPTDIVARLERFASDDARVVVADLDGEVLGFIAFHALPRFEHDDRIVRILALVVDAGVRERGVGHRLMEEAERAAQELGAAFVEVTAGHHRPEARHLYESLGYDATVTAYLRKRV
ncbi:MAG TPA: GNAT family N-acetyltransferase [Vitreimonas sp.]|nr:GNAT family N-acetyltransferase [Vitreimonas sp.]